MERQSKAASKEKYEKLIEDIGAFGKFQKRICLLLILSSIPNGYFALSMVFIGHTPPTYQCFIPGSDNQSENGNATDESEFVATSEPILASNRKNTTNPKECSVPEELATNASNSTGCLHGYVYGFGEGRTSITTEWNLVCDRAWILPLILSIYMAGVLLGSVISGTVSDKYGRYPTFIVGTLLMYIFLGLCGVAQSPPAFAAMLSGAGLFAFMNYVTAFIIGAEVVNTDKRVVIGTLTVGGFAVGYMLLPLFAYFIGDWRVLCVVLAALGVLYIPYVWLLDESPRWLHSKGKKKEFIKLFFKMAKTNGVSAERAKNLIENFYRQEDEVEGRLLASYNLGDVTPPSVAQYTYLDLLRHSTIRFRILCMWLTWFVCAVMYYGLALNTSNMGGDPYINCFVAAAVEIPAYAIAIGLLKCCGRKPVLIWMLLVAGLTCSAVPYLNQISNPLAITFAMIGKLSVSAAFSVIFIVCSELFPTLMRSMAIGSSSMFARIGGMIAPYLIYLGEFYESGPYLIMGFLGVAAAACNMLLPETRGHVLPEDIEDIVPMVCPLRLSRRKLKNRVDGKSQLPTF